MATPLKPLEEFGQKVAGALSAYSGERGRAVETARRRFLEVALRGTPTRTVRPRSVVALAMSAALAAVVLVVAFRYPAPLAFTADGKTAAPENWIAAPAERAVPLRFSDGTALQVEPSSRVRVVGVDALGASIALENGSISADVVHRPRSAWRVIAGPLTVRVTGTRFHLRWSAQTEEFSLAVREGSVAVSGFVAQEEQPVRAGQELRVFVGERRLELSRIGDPAQAAPAEPERPSLALETPAALEGSPPARPVASAVPSASAATRASAVPSLPAQEDWRALARRGSLRKAFELAEAAGFEAACQTATAAELLQLGDAARLSGRPDRANQALLTLRTRHPSDPRRAAAAFALGKVAFDQNGAYAKAAEWFATSIREQPGGSLSREAAGRLIEALRKSGDGAGARRAAKTYLSRYPDGPHADLARTVLE